MIRPFCRRGGPLSAAVSLLMLHSCAFAQEVTAQRPPTKSIQAFDADDRFCRSRALAVPLEAGKALYAQCMQQKGNLVRTDLPRVAPTGAQSGPQRSRSIQAASDFSDFIDRAIAQQPGFKPDFYSPSHWVMTPGKCMGIHAVESNRVDCVYDVYSFLKSKRDAFFEAPLLQDYNSKFASHYADLLRRAAALGDSDAARQLCTFLRTHGKYFPASQADQQCSEATTAASSAASLLMAEVEKSPQARAQRQRVAANAAYQAELKNKQVETARQQGEKDFRDAFATAFGAHIAASGDYMQIWSSPGAYFLTTAGAATTAHGDDRKQLFEKLKAAGREGYGPAWVWRTYLQAEGDARKRMEDASAALETGTPDGEFVYGATELEQPDATAETRKDAAVHMANGLQRGSLLGAMTIAISLEKQKSYENCMVVAEAVHQAGISLSEPQGYHCAMHLTEAQRKDAAKRAEHINVLPPDGFSLAEIQADHSGTETVENEIFEEQTRVRSATPPASLFKTMYSRYQLLQQRTVDKSMAGINGLLTAFAASMNFWAPQPGLASGQAQSGDGGSNVDSNRAKSAVMSEISIKQYEGVWIGRFKARQPGDDVSHDVRIKVKAANSHWTLLSVDNGGRETAAPSAFASGAWQLPQSDETPLEDSIADDLETYAVLDEFGFLD